MDAGYHERYACAHLAQESSHGRRCRAACYRELEHNGNAGAARALLQQGLRMCKGSQQLWAEYLRMELLYVHKLRSRRKVLGLDCPDAAPAASAAGGQQDAEEAEQQQEAVEEQDVEQDATSAAVRAVLTGAVAGVVYRNAVAAIPGDLGFREELIKVGRAACLHAC